MLAMIRPGVPVGDLFRMGTATVRSSGIPHYQRHHVGHGIGLEFYEAPVLVGAPCDDDAGRANGSGMTLRSGMVINVELPYYELGLGGLQIEDTVVIRSGGYERLTTSDHGLLPAGT
jgi:Xaa-Pro aminopeptidase